MQPSTPPSPVNRAALIWGVAGFTAVLAALVSGGVQPLAGVAVGLITLVTMAAALHALLPDF